MEGEATSLADGEYPVEGILHIEHGQAVVTIQTPLGLKPGTTIPLRRKECNLLVLDVPKAGEDRAAVMNGHGII